MIQKKYLQNKNRFTDTENRLEVVKEEPVGKGRNGVWD